MESGCIDPHILTSALTGDEWSASSPGRFTHGKRVPSTHCIGGWLDPRAGLNVVEKLKFLPPLGPELQPVGCIACSQSLYRLQFMYKIAEVMAF
jgi:hypothetical protein